MAENEYIKIFIAYSRKDISFLNQFRTHLVPLEHKKNVKLWYDGKIDPGSEWDKEIKNQIHSADIILLMISADSIASNYFYDTEVADALKRHEKGEAIVVPFIVRRCGWEMTPLGSLQALPKDGKAVVSWANQDDAYYDAFLSLWKMATKIEEKRRQPEIEKEKARIAEEKQRLAEIEKQQEEKKARAEKQKAAKLEKERIAKEEEEQRLAEIKKQEKENEAKEKKKLAAERKKKRLAAKRKKEREEAKREQQRLEAEREKGNERERLDAIARIYQTGDYGKTAKELAPFLEIYPENTLGWTILGHAHMELDQDSLAKKAYNKALAIDKKFVKAITSLGILERKAGNYDQAAQHYANAIKYDPTYAQAYSSLVIIKLKQGKFQEAVNVGLKAYDYDKNDPVIASNLAIAYHYNGNMKQRDAFYKIAKDTGYDNLDSLRQIFSGELNIY